jgi:hypothetical protein
MTAGRKAEGARLAPVEAVAAGIVKAIASGKRSAYVPARWGLIMMVVRNLPAFIFNRINA